MNQRRKCQKCGADFSYIPVGPGRPPVYCEKHRTNKNNASKGYGPVNQVNKPSAFKGYGNDAKRKHQATCYQILKEVLGQDQLDVNRSLATLCDDQTGSNSQFKHVMSYLLQEEDQYLGFCLDGVKVVKNQLAHPNANWLIGNMCSEFGINQMKKHGVQVIDYDTCWSLKNPQVRNELSSLLSSDLFDDLILMPNLLIKYRGLEYSEPEQTFDEMEKIPGFKGWEIQWFEDYVSETVGSPTYRTLILTKG